MILTENDTLQSILECSWFFPNKSISEQAIASWVQEHQNFLKPFGCAQFYPHKIVNIWPGETAENIIQKKKNAKNSLLQMFIDNCLQILRIMNLEVNKLQEMDQLLKEMEKPIREVVKKSAIESAGLTVRSTITIPKRNSLEKIVCESDIVDMAIEDACRVALWYLCWFFSAREISLLRKYSNPFLPLMEIFSSGLWPLGISQKEYIILAPGNTVEK